MFYLPYRTYSESSTSDSYVSDVYIKYILDGNSKFGAISISNPPTRAANVCVKLCNIASIYKV